MSNKFAVGVKFRQQDGWSKSYTYTAPVELPVGAIVLLPNKDFYQVGRVTGSMPWEKYESDPAVDYKPVLANLSKMYGI